MNLKKEKGNKKVDNSEAERPTRGEDERNLQQ
jgi:hypothetical protein